MRDKVEFPKNVPVEIALAYPTGKEGANDNGPYFMYTTADDRVFFATPTLNQKIQAQQPGAFERMAICLRNCKETGHKNIWEVRRIDPLPKLDPEGAGQGVGSTPTGGNARQLNNSNGNNGGSNGHNPPAYPPAPQPTPRPAPPSLMNGQGQNRLTHFTAAVDLCIAAKHYAHLCGLDLEIRFEDVRAVANTLAISADKNGGRQ